jgi:hypothetical protein
VRQRLPAATQTDDLDIVLAAAVGDGFYDRVEARDVAATSEDADALFHKHPLNLDFRELVQTSSPPFGNSVLGISP